MKLYIAELPAPRLYLSVPEAQPLILKSGPPAPELYLEKSKYTKRTGGPGNYKYEYGTPKDGGSKTPEVRQERTRSPTKVEIQEFKKFASSVNSDIRVTQYKTADATSLEVENFESGTGADFAAISNWLVANGWVQKHGPSPVTGADIQQANALKYDAFYPISALVITNKTDKSLRLAKAKYTRREGSPGNYKYYYDRASDAQKPFIVEEQTGFEFNEVATEKQITAALNKIPGVHNKDFLTLSEELESHGIAADTKMIGDAFDSGGVKGPSEEAGPSIPGMEGPFNFPGGHKLYYDPKEEGGKYYNREQDRYLDHEEGWRASTGNKKSFDPLYLDISKGNPNKEPAMGQFIGGGAGKAHGNGQASLEDQMKDLMNTLPGEEVEKAKYTSRTGSPGNYQYNYGEGGGSDGGKKDEKDAKEKKPKGSVSGAYGAGTSQGAGYASSPGGGGSAAVRDAPGSLSSVVDYFKPVTKPGALKQVGGEIANAARAAGKYFTGKSEGGQQS